MQATDINNFKGSFILKSHKVIPFKRKKPLSESSSSELLYERAMDCYQGSNGSFKSQKRTIFWLKLAADQGHPKAQFYLGCFFTGHLGLKENGKQAVHWLSMAAADGNTDSMNMLSKIYMRGYHGIKKDFRKSALFLRSAAELGDPEAQKAFAMILKVSQGVRGRELLGVKSGKVSDFSEEQKYSQYKKDLRKLSGMEPNS